MYGLPIFGVIIEALSEFARNFPALLKALIVPALGIFLIESIETNFPSGFPWTFGFWALSAPFYALFAVVCHRTVILGAGSLPSSVGIFWSERETRFVGWTIALTILGWFSAFLFGFLALIVPRSAFGMSTPWLPFLTLGLLFGYFYARLSLVFPATAVDHTTSLSIAWNTSSGHGARMVSAFVIVLIPAIAIYYMAAELILDPNGILSQVVGNIIWYLILALSICLLSVIYRVLSGMETVDGAA